MGGKMNWSRAGKQRRSGSLSIQDEREIAERDRASKWLTKKETSPKGKKTSANPSKPVNADSYEIFTDGACEPNPGTGGWACVVYKNGRPMISWQGGNLSTTNNRMEMIAVKQALVWLKERGLSSQAVVFTDSQYVAKGCNEWRHSWKRKGWKKKNSDLWIELDDLLSKTPVSIRWIPRDSKLGNKTADELSKEARTLVDRGFATKMTYDLSAEEQQRLSHFYHI